MMYAFLQPQHMQLVRAAGVLKQYHESEDKADKEGCQALSSLF